MHFLPCRNGEVVAVELTEKESVWPPAQPLRVQLNIASRLCEETKKARKNTFKSALTQASQKSFWVSESNVTIAWFACLFHDRNISMTAACDAQSLSLYSRWRRQRRGAAERKWMRPRQSFRFVFQRTSLSKNFTKTWKDYREGGIICGSDWRLWRERKRGSFFSWRRLKPPRSH